MKRILSILTVCTFALIWQGCNDDETYDVLPEVNISDHEVAGDLSMLDKYIQLPANARETVFNLKTKANWSVRFSDTNVRDLFDISANTGNGDGAIKVSLKEGAQMPMMFGLIFSFTNEKMFTKASTIEIERFVMTGIGDNDVVHDVLGRGMDIFADLNEKNVKGIVFDATKLGQRGKLETLTGGITQKNTIVTGQTYNSTTESWSAGMNGSVSMVRFMGLIPSPFQMSLNAMLDGSTTTRDSREFSISSLVSIIRSRKITDEVYSITENTPASLRDSVIQYLSVDAANDINGSTDNSSAAFEAIFQKYGTHVITAANFGGRYDYLYAREKNEYQSSIDIAGSIGLNKRVGPSVLKMYNVNAEASFSKSDSTSYEKTVSIEKERRLGGNTTSGDLNTWLENLASTDIKNLTMVSVNFDETNENKGLMPIYLLCKDGTRRELMKKGWEAYIKKHAIELTNVRQILADVVVVNATAGAEDGKYMEDPNGVERYYRKGRNISTINNADNVDDENYFFYAIGYADDETCGFTDIIIKHTDEAPKGYKARGSKSTEGITGVPTQHNRVYIKLRTADTPEKDLITGIKWVQEKREDSYTQGASGKQTWVKTKGEEWLKQVGRPHKDLFMYYTKSTVNK